MKLKHLCLILLALVQLYLIKSEVCYYVKTLPINKQDKMNTPHIQCIDDGLLKHINKDTFSKIAEIEVNPNATPKPDQSDIDLTSLHVADQGTLYPSALPKAVKENHCASNNLVFINEKGVREEIKISELISIECIKFNKFPQTEEKYWCGTWNIKYNNDQLKLIEIFTKDPAICNFYYNMFARYTILLERYLLLKNKFNPLTHLFELIDFYNIKGLSQYRYDYNLMNKNKILSILSVAENAVLNSIPSLKFNLEKVLFDQVECLYEKELLNNLRENYFLICKNLLREDYLTIINDQGKITEICNIKEPTYMKEQPNNLVININDYSFYYFSNHEDIIYLTQWYEWTEVNSNLSKTIFNIAAIDISYDDLLNSINEKIKTTEEKKSKNIERNNINLSRSISINNMAKSTYGKDNIGRKKTFNKINTQSNLSKNIINRKQSSGGLHKNSLANSKRNINDTSTKEIDLLIDSMKKEISCVKVRYKKERMEHFDLILDNLKKNKYADLKTAIWVNTNLNFEKNQTGQFFAGCLLNLEDIKSEALAKFIKTKIYK
jgi:hypothetical protein